MISVSHDLVIRNTIPEEKWIIKEGKNIALPRHRALASITASARRRYLVLNYISRALELKPAV